MRRLAIVLLLLFASVPLLGYGARSGLTAGPGQAAQSPAAALPETKKIISIAIGYAPKGGLGRFAFIDGSAKSSHWLEAWRSNSKSLMPEVVNYFMLPSYVITWGRGPVLTAAFDPNCLAPEPVNFGQDDYWVAQVENNKLTYLLLDQEEEKKKVKGLFTNLQVAEQRYRVQGRGDTVNRTNTWEENIISLFQPEKRKWINQKWVQELTTCRRY